MKRNARYTLTRFGMYSLSGKVLVTFVLVIGLCSWKVVAPKPKPKPTTPVYVGSDGKLMYTPDEQGNRIPDFSYCGYMASDQPIPDVPVRIVVPLTKGDATVRIQAAIDYVGTLQPDKNGIRGAVLLEKGAYEVDGSLKINTSGVVLRGSGMDE
ncbi:MAG TPA: hypothetical protein VIH57_24920, partial [Bacteroidales bacterium]